MLGIFFVDDLDSDCSVATIQPMTGLPYCSINLAFKKT